MPIPIVPDRLMKLTVRPPINMVKGRGSWLYDDEGNKYLDFVQGRAVNSLGHCPGCVTSAISKQAAQLINPGSLFYSLPSLQLANLLIESSCFAQVFFANSGTEANECAIKLARKWGKTRRRGAFEIITLVNGFHGRTFGSMSATGKLDWGNAFAPLVQGFRKARINDISSVEALIGSETAAIMIELVQGEAGVICADPAFVRDLRRVCDDHNILLIFDEVQTGIGRLGTLFGYQLYEVEPDIVTLGKGIGGGVPLSATLAKHEACVFEYGDHGGTFNGNPLITKVGFEVVREILKPGFLQRITEMGAHLGRSLEHLSAELELAGQNGHGLLRRLDLGSDIGPRVVEFARERLRHHVEWANVGILLNSPRPNLLRFMPALTVSKDEIDLMVRGLRTAIRATLERDGRQRCENHLGMSGMSHTKGACL